MQATSLVQQYWIPHGEEALFELVLVCNRARQQGGSCGTEVARLANGSLRILLDPYFRYLPAGQPAGVRPILHRRATIAAIARTIWTCAKRPTLRRPARHACRFADARQAPVVTMTGPASLAAALLLSGRPAGDLVGYLDGAVSSHEISRVLDQATVWCAIHA